MCTSPKIVDALFYHTNKLALTLVYLIVITVVPLPKDQGMLVSLFNKKEVISSKVVRQVIVKLPEINTDEIALTKGAINKVYGREMDSDLIEHIYNTADRYGVDSSLVLGLIAAESSFRSNVRSRVGAVGYTQVWPKWHLDKIAGRDILDPYVNIDVGVMFLSECIRRKSHLYDALACYNGSNSKESADRYYVRVQSRSHELTLAMLEVAGI